MKKLRARYNEKESCFDITDVGGYGELIKGEMLSSFAYQFVWDFA